MEFGVRSTEVGVERGESNPKVGPTILLLLLLQLLLVDSETFMNDIRLMV